MNLADKIKLISSIPRPSKWEDLTSKQQELFADKEILKLISFIYSKKCFMCKCKFDRPFADQDGINGEYLFHLQSTHGLPPDMMEIIIKERFFKDEPAQ